jgi:hypothetical protein
VGEINEDGQYDGTDVRCAKSIVRDLLRMQGVLPMTDKEYSAKYHRSLA